MGSLGCRLCGSVALRRRASLPLSRGAYGGNGRTGVLPKTRCSSLPVQGASGSSAQREKECSSFGAEKFSLSRGALKACRAKDALPHDLLHLPVGALRPQEDQLLGSMRSFALERLSLRVRGAGRGGKDEHAFGGSLVLFAGAEVLVGSPAMSHVEAVDLPERELGTGEEQECSGRDELTEVY